MQRRHLKDFVGGLFDKSTEKTLRRPPCAAKTKKETTTGPRTNGASNSGVQASPSRL